jgi:gamma-glutamyltranspeptidase/glutathione hydrolase
MKFVFKHVFMLLLCSTFLIWSCRHADQEVYQLIKSAVSDQGMVVSAHPLASEVGLRILKSGGNAADACIAVQLALAVVHPRAGNIGGGGFLVYRNQLGQVHALDYREKAPLTAHRDMFIDTAGKIIENLSTEGILAAGVPGTIAGLVEIHNKLGKLQPWSRLVEPAIELAEKGFQITKMEADRLNKYKSDFQKYNAVEIPFVKKEIWKPGDVIVQKTLAKTLRVIAKQGRDGFYAGSNVESIVALSKEKTGLITADDMKSYQAIWRTPLVIPWRDYTIYSMPLPSSGGVIIGQILGMLNPHLVDSLGYRNVQNVHLLVEAERRAFTDRAQFLGDQDFYSVPVDSLLNPIYLQMKMSDFNPERATDSKLITN